MANALELTWENLESAVRDCRRCVLCRERTNTVVGRGSRTAPLMFVGEGPGRQEDEQGSPFVGAAGQLLDVALASLYFGEEDYYIANVVKCRPPGNRTPQPAEAQACLGFLRAQFSLIRPSIIVCLGAVAHTNLVSAEESITRARGKWIEKKGIWFMSTFHPAALLRDESKKLPFWQDLKAVKQKLEEVKAARKAQADQKQGQL
ncbi:MAG: uracil-DNA glycosylase [Clostridia bacterium]|nr:uracil-DNA glycosylase [Clostridia bacterium]